MNRFCILLLQALFLFFAEAALGEENSQPQVTAIEKTEQSSENGEEMPAQTSNQTEEKKMSSTTYCQNKEASSYSNLFADIAVGVISTAVVVVSIILGIQ